ncbi:MAG: efflux RND transporter periplasmic adaptor subunit [Thermodesulfobacteriota bacterium]
MKKSAVIITVVAAMAAIAVYFLAPVLTGNGEPPLRLKTGKVLRGDLVVVVAATGVITPYVEVEVKSKAAGEILSFPFNEGDTLEKGRVVVRLDPATEKSRVNQARADRLMAEGKLDRARVSLKDTTLKKKRKEPLFEKGVISRQELDDSVIAFEKAQSEITIAEAELLRATEVLREAEDRLEDTEIRAPLGGTVLIKLVEEGQVISSTISSVSEGTTLFTMADLAHLYVGAMVDEVDIGQVVVGQSVGITVDSWPDRLFAGRIARIAPKGRVERTVTVFDVVVDITEEKKTGLMPGMSANVEIATDRIQGTLLIPSEAVRVENKETGVYIPAAAGPAWAPIKTGKTDGITTEVTEGLKEGDEVIISGYAGDEDNKSGSKKRRLYRRH